MSHEYCTDKKNSKALVASQAAEIERLEAQVAELQKDKARVDALELLIRCRLWHDRVSWLFRPDDRSPPGSIVGGTLREVIDKHITALSATDEEPTDD